MRRLVFAALLGAVVAAGARAQRAPATGDQVRLELRDGRFLAGHVDAVADSALLLRALGSSVSMWLPQQHVVAYTRRIGLDHAAGAREGARVGAMVGGVVFLAWVGVGARDAARGSCGDCARRSPLADAGLRGVAGFIGATAGSALLGYILGRDRWAPWVAIR